MKRGLLMVFLVLLAPWATAESLRCGRALVRVGDSASTLLGKCGDPALTFSGQAPVSAGTRSRTVTVSHWVYRRSGKRDMRVAVRHGRVVGIELDRGQ